jgi:DNA-binding HxlR family transcriptional regulator
LRDPGYADSDILGGRDREILRVIEEEDLESFSFEGLKRRTGLHPETLSRALGRLEEQSIVERAPGGYRVTPGGQKRALIHPAQTLEERMTLLKTMLPPGVGPESAFQALKGKWFGSLRWLGYSQGDGDLTMKWVTDDGSVQLDAKFTAIDLTIEGRLLQGRSLASAVTAAHQLLAHISRSYGKRSYDRRLLFEVSSPFMAAN